MRTEQVLQLHPVRLPEHLQLRQRRELHERDHALPRPRVLLLERLLELHRSRLRLQDDGLLLPTQDHLL